MKNLVFLMLFALSAYSPMAAAEWLIGVKAGSVQMDIDDLDFDEDPINGGLILGYGFRSGFSYDFEFTRAYEPGTVGETEIEVESQALYLTYRSAGTWFFKLRGGLSQSGTEGDLNDADVEQSYGVGVGWRLGKSIDLGLDYTMISGEVALAALGVSFWF